MRVVVTRPAAQAHELVQALAAHGVAAVALPLIAIEPLATPAARQALAEARAALAAQRLVMFVSANAVAAFCCAAAAEALPPWPRGTLAGATGPGTVAALRAAGVPAQAIVAPPDDAPQLDSEALWQRLRTQPWQGARVLVVRGEGGGRDWLADTLRAAGAQVQALAAYRRTRPQWQAAEMATLAQAEADPAGHAWHLSSSEAVHHLPALAPGGAWRASVALAAHERIAEAAREAGFVRVQVVAPGVPALAVAVRGLPPGELRRGA